VEGAPSEFVTAEQACQQLSLSPHTLRRLLREFRDLFSPPPEQHGLVLTQGDLRRLATIARLRAEGADGATIRAALLSGSDAPGAGAEPGARADQPAVWSAALERLERLDESLRALEQRWREDRDRIEVLLLRRIYKAPELFQLLAAFALVLTLNRLTIYLSVVGLFLAASYPYLKRYTYLPQVYLGLAFGWGIPMAFAAVKGTVPPEAASVAETPKISVGLSLIHI